VFLIRIAPFLTHDGILDRVRADLRFRFPDNLSFGLVHAHAHGEIVSSRQLFSREKKLRHSTREGGGGFFLPAPGRASFSPHLHVSFFLLMTLCPLLRVRLVAVVNKSAPSSSRYSSPRCVSVLVTCLSIPRGRCCATKFSLLYHTKELVLNATKHRRRIRERKWGFFCTLSAFLRSCARGVTNGNDNILTHAIQREFWRISVRGREVIRQKICQKSNLGCVLSFKTLNIFFCLKSKRPKSSTHATHKRA